MDLSLSEFVPQIHSTERRKLKSSVFGYSTTVVLLDYLGLDDYFITEYGQVWNRYYAKKDNEGNVIKGFVPLTYIDNTVYPWVFLKHNRQKVRIPINLLMGWSYYPTKDTEMKFYSFNDGLYIAGIHTVHDGTWKTLCDQEISDQYRLFIDRLYSD